ncbi:MAG: NAD-dependent epimerase/dehydratase family protein [Gammaproteobacteria bacterium]|nr:NAD-dependent epimerase/dehydratase family protein [Gammaproteobacteria bacterium]
MTTLVTGATGFVGAAVARQLLDAGHAVRVLTRAHSDPRNLQGLIVERVVGDLTEPASLERAITGCDTLFHVAADYRLWALDPAPIYAANVEGTRNIMRAALAAKVRRVVYTSSVATLGTTRDGAPADERTPVTLDDMIGDYKRSKFLAEAEVHVLIADAGLPAVIVNPSTPVGPGDIKPTPTGRMVADAAKGRMPAYVDTGLNIVHVEDVAQGHLHALERGVIGERYVLGGENLSLKQILTTIAELSGRRPPRIRVPHNILLPIAHLAEGFGRLLRAEYLPLTVDSVRMAKKRMYYSSDKARRELGYAPRPASEALRDAVAWFLHGASLEP